MEPWSWEYEDASKPRPPDVAVVEALLNTVDHHRFGNHSNKPQQRRDLLTSPTALTRWLRGHDLLRRGERVSDRDVDAARRLRDGLRAWLAARQGLEHDEQALDEAAGVLRDLPLQASLVTDQVRLVPAEPAYHSPALARFVARLAAADASGVLDRLRVCSAPDCRFVFYDHSRSRTSRWCSMSTCGNRFKTRRYRARRGVAG